VLDLRQSGAASGAASGAEVGTEAGAEGAAKIFTFARHWNMQL